VRNESALADLLSEEDRQGIVFNSESDWVDTWEAALYLLDVYPWHKLHAGQVHPEFRQKVWAAVQSRSKPARRRPLWRRIASYFDGQARKEARWAKARTRRQLSQWQRACSS
jgi:hypothetical protein